MANEKKGIVCPLCGSRVEYGKNKKVPIMPYRAYKKLIEGIIQDAAYSDNRNMVNACSACAERRKIEDHFVIPNCDKEDEDNELIGLSDKKFDQYADWYLQLIECVNTGVASNGLPICYSGEDVRAHRKFVKDYIALIRAEGRVIKEKLLEEERMSEQATKKHEPKRPTLSERMQERKERIKVAPIEHIDTPVVFKPKAMAFMNGKHEA